ncbi:MAG TPA: M1 family aminopeptidase [Bryobacteraceae bacterium]|nr:M1 family aminopeptidase [Bryobacteraceae bacterium]
MKALAAIVGLSWLVPLAAAPLPRPFTVEHYDVRITADLAAKQVAGEVTMRIASRIERLSAVELDAGDLEVTRVTEGQAVAYFERKGKLLIVVLGNPARNEERRTLTIRYTAKPAKGLVFFPDQVYTSFFTSDWMPCDDRPDDPATLRLTIEPPPNTKVAASGRFDGAAWVVDTPTPTFLFAFAAGNFAESTAEANGVKLRVLGKADVFETTGAALRFLADRSGKPYPGDTYTQVFAHGQVEQEAVGLTLLPESYIEKLAKQPDDLWLLVHELAHQWYGIGIPAKDWSDFWLSEGMATFLADAFLEQRCGKARYDHEIEQSHATYESLRNQGKDRPLYYTDWQTPQQAGGRIPYDKGAWVLAELRRQLTDEVFWKGLRLYTSEHWGTAVTSTDFQQSMQAAAGKDLTKFFERWVY